MLSCSGLIDPVRLSEESLGDPEQVARQRYVDDPDVHAPSVISLNDMGTGWASNDFMQFMVGLGRPAGGFRVLRTKPVGAAGVHVTVQERPPNRAATSAAPPATGPGRWGTGASCRRVWAGAAHPGPGR
jgi:hypothetical protein